ncbi:MAG: glycoside hydrolase family 2, partial [Butyrivibrio sp.]|nr:glycoside hydrolase family 2 [Butyrivibrio sp.]
DGEKLLPDNEIMVCVQDSTDTSWHSRGKQKLKRGGMYYTAQSGIWQTVWLEWVPDTYITNLKITPQKDLKTVKISVKTNGKCNVVLDVIDAICNTTEPELFDKTFREAFVAEPGKSAPASPAPYKIVSKAEHHSEDMKSFTTTFTCEITNPKLWSPEKPFLYGLIVRAGLDIITSYFGMRCFTIDRDKYGYNTFCLNHKPYFLNGVLDQGYWPDGLYTAPSDEAFIFDIKTMKKHGFNMLRKHIKIEAARYYYHCDRIGMIVWQDMVSGGYDYSKPLVSYLPTLFPKVFSSMPDGPESYRMFRRESAEGRKEWTEEMIATIKLLINCPCISTWVLFNEGWGQFNAAAATIIAGKVDPSRLIDQASGWFDEHSGDFLSVHNYFRPLSPARDKFGRAYVISEYGGLATHIDGHSSVDRIYGYKKYETKKEFKAAYNNLINNTLMPLAKKGLSGAVYTQLSDVEEEVNGILTYDRKIDKLE